MSSRLRVLVVGASIAGPASAYWLARAGAEVTVLERFPSIRKGGQAIDIRASGVTVMRKMPGMEELVRSKPAGEEAVTFVRGDGKSYGILRASGNPDQQSLLSEYEIMRGDLANILYQLTVENDRIKYVFGDQVVSIQQPQSASGSVWVEFATDSRKAEFDLVVAADGATSRTRSIGLSWGARDHIHPSDIWAAYFTTQKDFLEGSSVTNGYSAPGARFITVAPRPTEGGNDVMMMTRGSGEAFRHAQARHQEKEFVATTYQDAGWICRELVEEMKGADDFYANEIVQVKLPRLSTDSFTVVGDAGYAVGPTGFGTSIALTGAYILGGEIAKHPGDVQTALQEYEAKMRPMIKEMQKTSPFLAAIATPQSAWVIWLRNNIFGLIARSGIVEILIRWFGGGAFADRGNYPVPEYKWPD